MLLVYALEDACNNLVGANFITSFQAFAKKSMHALLPLHRRGQLHAHPTPQKTNTAANVTSSQYNDDASQLFVSRSLQYITAKYIVVLS